MPRCCPFLEHGHCLVAMELRLCRDGGGSCVVVPDRCCGTIYSESLGEEIREWELCRLYRLGEKKGVRKRTG